MLSYLNFSKRLSKIQKKIKNVCKLHRRATDSVTLMAVTKNHPIEIIQYAERAGIASIGESRVQEAFNKYRENNKWNMKWELIGHLQSNKVKTALQLFNRIQSVDSHKLIVRLNRICEEIQRSSISILLQVNTANDPSKKGILYDSTAFLLEQALKCQYIKIDGLMTIAQLSKNKDSLRHTFARLRKLKDKLSQEFGIPLKELSMGMSYDMEDAIAEGSTLLRLGKALFNNYS